MKSAMNRLAQLRALRDAPHGKFLIIRVDQ